MRNPPSDRNVAEMPFLLDDEDVVGVRSTMRPRVAAQHRSSPAFLTVTHSPRTAFVRGLSRAICRSNGACHPIDGAAQRGR